MLSKKLVAWALASSLALGTIGIAGSLRAADDSTKGSQAISKSDEGATKGVVQKKRHHRHHKGTKKKTEESAPK